MKFNSASNTSFLLRSAYWHKHKTTNIKSIEYQLFRTHIKYAELCCTVSVKVGYRFMDIMASLHQYAISYFACLFIVCLLQTPYSSSQFDFKYPNGSIPCKTHAETTLDCSNRMLDDIPPLDQNSTTELDLSFNRLTKVNRKPFQNVLLLWSLDLSYNIISQISSGVFDGLYSLEILHLQNNKLDSLPSDIFANLTHLQLLNISNNFFSTVPPRVNWSTMRSLKRLTILSGDTSSLRSLEIGEGFKNLTNMTTLSIFVAGLHKTITRNAFQYLTGLPIKHLQIFWLHYEEVDIPVENGTTLELPIVQTLTITYKALNSLEFLCPQLRTLSVLVSEEKYKIMNASSLKKLGQWSSTLTNLTLRFVTTDEIANFTFTRTPLLTKLDLVGCAIKNLMVDSFSGLNNLKNLTLGMNRLDKVPSHTFHAFQSGSLQNLDLSSNRIGFVESNAFSLLPFLQYLNLAENGLMLETDYLNTVTSLSYLKLGGTGIEYYATAFETSSSSLEILYANKAKEIVFQVCEMCCLFPNLRHVIFTNVVGVIREFPSSLALHKCLQLTNLDLSGSIKSWDFSRTDTILPKLRTLILADTELTSVKQFLFIKANLTRLNLRRNNIETIENSDFLSFPHLIHLDLEGNSLISIDGIRLLKCLVYLNVAANELTTGPSWIFSSADSPTPPLKTLDWSNNPFQCSCSIEPLRKWLLSDTTVILLGAKYACATPRDKV